MNILLICYAGMSTSLLIKKLEKTAKEKDLNYTFDAIGTFDFDDYIEEHKVDYILVGPQARHMFKELELKVINLNIPIKVIDSLHYGRMDADAILSMLD